MTVNNRNFRVVATGAAAALLIAVAACSSAKPAVTFVHVTASPSPSALSTEPSETDTPASTDTPFVVPTDTPAPTEVASLTPTPTPTPTPSPTPSGPAGGCTGSDDNKAWWTGEAPHLPFTVYCGHMPSGWYFSTASDNWKSGGKLDASYKGPAGATLSIDEGAFCTSNCSTGTSIGTAKFGDLSGGLYSLGTGAGYAIYVNPGTARGYSAVGKSMSQATFTNLAAALIQVPKS